MKCTERKLRKRGRWPVTVMTLVLILALSTAWLPVQADTLYYPKCAASCDSLVDALKSVGADASFGSRQRIAGYNGIPDYSGAAAQNIRLLNLLKSGMLRRSAAPAEAPLAANLWKVQYIAQEPKTCKATAVAMAVNLLRGNNACTTAGMGGSWCSSIEGEIYTGSDGLRYTGVYKTDSYTGSAAELSEAISEALAAGAPIAVPVHSTAGGTRHHWVTVVGRSGDDLLIADPAFGTSGAVGENAVTLSARHYALGLTDFSAPHYGYVTFVRR